MEGHNGSNHTKKENCGKKAALDIGNNIGPKIAQKSLNRLNKRSMSVRVEAEHKNPAYDGNQLARSKVFRSMTTEKIWAMGLKLLVKKRLRDVTPVLTQVQPINRLFWAFLLLSTG